MFLHSSTIHFPPFCASDLLICRHRRTAGLEAGVDVDEVRYCAVFAEQVGFVGFKVYDSLQRVELKFCCED